VIDQKVLRDALGWGAIGLALVVVGALLSATGSGLGAPALVIGGMVLVVCLATLAHDLLGRRD
jgi:hypothetical protein